MCGACPGGGRLSDETLALAQLLSPMRTAALVAELTGGRLRISSLGDGWSVALPTGGMSVVTDFEGLVRMSKPFVRADRLEGVQERLVARPDRGVAYLLACFATQ